MKYTNYLKGLLGAFFLVLYPIMVPWGHNDQDLHSDGRSPEFEFLSWREPV